MTLPRRIAVGVLLACAPACPSAGQSASQGLGEAIAWQAIPDSEEPEISGIVVGPGGRPLEDVLVRITELSQGAVSDGAGRFQFAAPPPGEWTLSLELIGFEEVRQVIIVPSGSSVTVAGLLARQRAICTNACVGTSCLDLGIQVVDESTGRRPEVPVILRVEFTDSVLESVTPYDPDPRLAPWVWVGLGRPIETIGWHSLELAAEGYETWRARVWLERISRCHGHLLRRELEVALRPVG